MSRWPGLRRRHRPGERSIWTTSLTVGLWSLVLALGLVVLQWIDYQRMARTHLADLALGLVAVGFLALGLMLGMRWARSPAPSADGNPQAQAELRISDREREVLLEMAAGHSNKEIAARLKVSPNTVKTHAAHLFEKLGARRRVDAINKARLLGLLP